jgi:membrane protein YqaA with SNARE-associated domain
VIGQKLERFKIQSRDWFVARAHGGHAKFWLTFLSFSDSSFFLLPPDPLLVAILMVKANRWAYYALLTTIASVLGAIFGYLVGAFFFDTLGIAIINFYGLSGEFNYARTIFDENVFAIIFAAAFTPIPFKIFVLLAGFLKVNPVVFLLAAVIGRGSRFFLVAYITKIYGSKMAMLLFHYFNIITFTLVVIVVAVIASVLLL